MSLENTKQQSQTMEERRNLDENKRGTSKFNDMNRERKEDKDRSRKSRRISDYFPIYLVQ